MYDTPKVAFMLKISSIRSAVSIQCGCVTDGQTPRASIASRGKKRVLRLQVISLAGWVNIMYYIQDAHSFWDWIYFVALIIVSHFVQHIAD